MSATAINWIVAAASALTALGILGAAVRRSVRALIDGVRVVRQLLELQPRVVELGERLVVLVEQQTGHGARLDRLETAVFPLKKESSHAS
ncbi:hypothetical protein [Streptomyces sp. NRRL S-146]|uniref:hypothetical protein n=1 Tax=Streptomyces sp. NRRL S-146 TaxID=1463884 RepID=UPI0004CBDE51|nr:hypothetical protein [Streptomyces sp. NRRL S-146]